MTELLLMFASRAQAAAEINRPGAAKRESGSERPFYGLPLAYQGEARGLGFDKVLEAHELAMGSLLPDLTIWIEVDVEQGLARARQRNANRSRAEQSEDRIDQQSL